MNQRNNIKTYLDESGNSGKNLLDLNQPFLTLGSVLIDDTELDKIEKFFSTIPTELRDEQGEIKGNNIACYNQSLALNILSDFLPQHSEMFFFSVLEKKFMIAGQIVENYFDCVYNDNTDESWLKKSDMKIDLANFFYDNLSSDAMLNAHKAFLSKSVETLKSSFYQIIEEIKDVEYAFDVVSLITGAENHMQSLSDSLSKINSKNTIAKGVPKNTISTPNVTAYFELIGRIEKYLTTKDITSILIFDNSEQYNKIFKEMLDMMIKAPRQKFAISDDEYLQFGFKHLIDYKTDESNKSIGLQLADIISSTVNHVFSKVIQKQDENLTHEDIMLTGFVYLVSIEPPSGYWTVSKSTYTRIREIISKIK